MKKIAVVGAGNAGCITALHYYYHGKDLFEIDIYHDDTPIERVGQGTTLNPTELLGEALDIDWYNNPIDATFKSGVLYEGWGKKLDKVFHPFPLETMAMHYIPEKLSNVVLNSGKFKVIKKTINDPEQEIDSDYIFDCRGRHSRDKDDYTPLINPLNSVFLATKEGRDTDLHYTRSVATPNGWTFIIPNTDSVSYGYLYNNTITPREEAMSDFLERFELPEVNGDIVFENYIANNIFIGTRTILNGNKASFLEPLEATATNFAKEICTHAWDSIVENVPTIHSQTMIKMLMKEYETFVLWHYQKGSKYNTPFWEYAKSLPFEPTKYFNDMLTTDEDRIHGQWNTKSFKIWKEV